MTSKADLTSILILSLNLIFSQVLWAQQAQQSIKQLIEEYEKDNCIKKAKSARFLLDNIQGLGTYDGKRFIADNQQLNYQYLKNNIEHSFFVNENLHAGKNISFTNFCEYVLPYRINYEKLENWKEVLLKKYKWLHDSLKQGSIVSSISLINKDIKSWFHFGANEQPENIMGFSDFYQSKEGSCFAMATVALYTMRSVGLPIMQDYCTWANANGNHTWNSVYDENNQVLPFLGAESDPIEYNPFLLMENKEDQHLTTYRKCAKVFRRTFSVQKESLASQVKDNSSIPKQFQSSRIVDVTKEYTEVSDIKINVSENRDSFKYAYLCVFNTGRWIPVCWGKIENSHVIFEELGKGIVYLPAYYSNNQLIPFDSPFILLQNGEIQWLNPQLEKRKSLILTHVASQLQAQLAIIADGMDKPDFHDRIKIVNEVNGKYPDNNTLYYLFHWDKEWKLVGKTQAIGKHLEFSQVPSNGLYIVTNTGKIQDERVFTYTNGEQVFW